VNDVTNYQNSVTFLGLKRMIFADEIY